MCFDSLDVGKRGFVDSRNNIKIRYRLLDSLKTNDSELLNDLLNLYDFLDVRKYENGFIVKGFEKIRSDVINIGLEAFGKTIVGGVFLNYVYKEKHSFDINYGSGYGGYFLHTYRAKNMYSAPADSK